MIMPLTRTTTKIVILALFIPLFLMARNEIPSLMKGWEIRMGMGYFHTGPDMNEIWSDGFAWEMLTVGYKPVKFFGFETGFILGLTGIQNTAKNKVLVYDTSTGDTGSQESSGGAWGGIPFGGRISIQLFHLPVVIGLGGGGIYGFEEESGINAENYTDRMTKGLGYYLLASLHFINNSVKNPGGWGIQCRYVGGSADATDFNSSLGINPKTQHSLMEGRLLITADIYFDLKSHTH